MTFFPAHAQYFWQLHGVNYVFVLSKPNFLSFLFLCEKFGYVPYLLTLQICSQEGHWKMLRRPNFITGSKLHHFLTSLGPLVSMVDKIFNMTLLAILHGSLPALLLEQKYNVFRRFK